jgi:hypothetical protein
VFKLIENDYVLDEATGKASKEKNKQIRGISSESIVAKMRKTLVIRIW